MALSLEPLWETLETNFPLGGARKHLRGLLGDDLVGALESAGILAQRRVADTYPCPGTGGFDCPRVIVSLDDGTYAAVCGNEPAACAELTLSAEDVAHLSVDPENLCAAVAAALKIRGTPEAVPGLAHVYRAGNFIPDPGVRHPVYFAVRCQRRDYAEVLDAIRSRQDGGAFAVMVPTDRFLAEDTVRQMTTLGIPLLPLCDAVGLDGTALTALVDPLRYFAGIGGRGAGPAPVAAAVVAQALVCRGDGDATWRNLDEAGYQDLVAAADQYEIFADERGRTAARTVGGERQQRSGVQASYFQFLRACARHRGYFDPGTDLRFDEIYKDPKQNFVRARKAIDVKTDDNWKLFKTRMVDNHAKYEFSPDQKTIFALVFQPAS